MARLRTVQQLRARRAVVAAQAERHAAKHDSKSSLPTARRYADRLARLDARIAAALGFSDECPQCSRIGAGPLCKDHRAPVAGAVTLTATDKQNLLGALTGPTTRRATGRTQNFLVEGLNPDHEAECDATAAQARYEAELLAAADVERPDHDTRDREGRDTDMAVVGAARMYLTHVHEGVRPSDVTALAWLAEAGRVLGAAGIDRLDVAQLRAAAGLPALEADPARSATERGGAVVVATSRRHVVIDDATPAYEDSVLKSRHVLALAGTYYRFGVGGIPRGQSGRKVYQGPLVPGPWAFAFGLGTVLAANPEMGTGAEIERNLAAGIEHTVEAGDRVTFDGVTYVVAVERRQFINLVAEGQ